MLMKNEPLKMKLIQWKLKKDSFLNYSYNIQFNMYLKIVNIDIVNYYIPVYIFFKY